MFFSSPPLKTTKVSEEGLPREDNKHGSCSEKPMQLEKKTDYIPRPQNRARKTKVHVRSSLIEKQLETLLFST